MSLSANDPMPKPSYKALVLAVAAFAFIFAFVYLYGIYASAHATSQAAPLIKIQVDGHNYTVFYATTPYLQQKGLMNFTFNGTSIAGELFANLSSYPCFWMKNTPVPLQQAWLSGNTVIYIYNGTPESTATICHNGTAVLELKQGINISIGSSIRIIGNS